MTGPPDSPFLNSYSSPLETPDAGRDPASERSVLVFQRGSLDVKLSFPVPPNERTPHAQDEIYVIVHGRGVLVHDAKRDPFESGDILFVAAGTEHHYEDLTDDLALWRVIYGPAGCEIPA